MTDLDQLITARHPCLAVATFEEEYVLGLLREIAVERGWELWLWSITQGVRDGLIADIPAIPDTDHPAAALYHVGRQQQAVHKPALFVMVDLADHLKDGRTLRLLREAIDRVAKSPGGLGIIRIEVSDDPAAQVERSVPPAEARPPEDDLRAVPRMGLREPARRVGERGCGDDGASVG